MTHQIQTNPQTSMAARVSSLLTTGRCETMVVFTTPRTATAFLRDLDSQKPLVQDHNTSVPTSIAAASRTDEEAAHAETVGSAATPELALTIRRHYEALLGYLRADIDDAAVHNERDKSWIAHAFIDTAELYELDATVDATSTTTTAGVTPRASEQLIGKALARWTSSRHGGGTAAHPVPSALLVVVLQDVDFSCLSLTSMPPCPLPVRHVARASDPASARACNGDAPRLSHGYPLMNTHASTPTSAVSSAKTDAHTIKTMVVTSTFMVHSLFFRAWCCPADFGFAFVSAHAQPTLLQRRLSLPVPASSSASLPASPTVVELVVEVVISPEDTPDDLSAVLRRHLHGVSLGFDTLCRTTLATGTEDETAAPEESQLRAVLLCPPRPGCTRALRKRSRQDTDPDTDNTHDGHGDDTGTPTDIFTDAARAAESQRVALRHTLFATPLQPGQCHSVTDSVLETMTPAHDLVDADDDDDAAETLHEPWHWWTGAELAALRRVVDWQTVSRRGWRLLPGSGGSGGTDGHERAVWLAAAVEKAKILMDCLHVRDVCRPRDHARHNLPKQSVCRDDDDDDDETSSDDATQASVWELQERALRRVLRSDPNCTSPHDEDASTCLTLSSLQSRMCERVCASLAQLAPTAAAHTLWIDIMQAMPNTDAASAFTDPVWQRAVLVAPRLPLEAFQSPTREPATRPAETDDAVISAAAAAADEEEEATELSDWVIASCTVPNLQTDQNNEKTSAQGDWPVLVHNRVGTFFRDAVNVLLKDATVAQTDIPDLTGEEARASLGSASASLSASDWSEVVWLVVQAHKHELAAWLSLFHSQSTSAMPDPSSSVPMMAVLRQFWDQVAAKVRAIMMSDDHDDDKYDDGSNTISDIEDTATDCGADGDDGSEALLLRASYEVSLHDDASDATAGAHQDDTDNANLVQTAGGDSADAQRNTHEKGLPTVTASQSTSIGSSSRDSTSTSRFTGFDALCLYMKGTPSFAHARLNEQPEAGADRGDAYELPWLQHLLFLLSHGQSDPLAHAAPDKGFAALHAERRLAGRGQLPAPASTTPTTTKATDGDVPFCPSLLLEYERLAAVQVAAEAHQDLYDQVIGAAYTVYAERWRVASAWLDAAVTPHSA